MVELIAFFVGLLGVPSEQSADHLTWEGITYDRAVIAFQCSIHVTYAGSDNDWIVCLDLASADSESAF